MDLLRPAYLDFLAALSASGLATRPGCEIERVLAECQHCPRWTLAGCGMLSSRQFAALLADAGRTCDFTFPASESTSDPLR